MMVFGQATVDRAVACLWRAIGALPWRLRLSDATHLGGGSHARVDGDGCVDGEEDVDDDQDGVLNEADVCPRTPLSTIVDGAGCSAQQADTDSDGVLNDADLCPSSALGEIVDEQGCKVIEVEKKSEEASSSFGLNQLLIFLAIALAGVAGYITFKPVKTASSGSEQKTVPVLETVTEPVEAPVQEVVENSNSEDAEVDQA